MNNNVVHIKGSKNGLIFTFDITDTPFKEVCFLLEDKLVRSGDFFSNAEYVIDNPSVFSEEQLQIIEQIMEKHRLIKGEPTPHIVPIEEKQEVIYQANGGDSVLITRSVRGGQKVSVRGNAIIMGDINAGGEIIASGNIVVMGVCRGVLHAGAEGDHSCYIIAYGMAAQQIRIADLVATVPPEIASSPLKAAMIKDGGIVLTDYNPPLFKNGHIA
ncbi:MAG: hypothetical protein K6B40_01025 [Firmicutes bacterium]|nr:hypothetical protein [Bacillota bacterium]